MPDHPPDDPALDHIRRIAVTLKNLYSPEVQNLIGLDPTDVEGVLRDGGQAAFGEGEATGEGRATKAAERAIADLKQHMAGR